MTLAKMGKNEEALQTFFQLDYENSEDDTNTIACIAITALSLGKLDVAERYTEKEIQLTDGKNCLSYLRMGHIHLLRGNWKNSLESYEQFINIFCKETGGDAKAALEVLNTDWSNRKIANGIMVNGQMVNAPDLLLIHDILQSASEGTIGT